MGFDEHGGGQAGDRGVVGKIPTTFVRRLSSLFSRSSGLVLHSLRQWATGTCRKAVRSSLASTSSAATAGNRGWSVVATLSTWSATSAGVSWAKMVRMVTATISAEALGTRARALRSL